jgi:hypothetical protein
MKANEFFNRVGGTLWLIGFGTVITVLLLWWGGVVHGRQFPWRNVLLVFGISGLVSFIIGGVCAIWEEDY